MDNGMSDFHLRNCLDFGRLGCSYALVKDSV